MNKIIAPTWQADDGPTDNLISVSCFLGNSISGDELSIDTMDAVVDDRKEGMTEFAPADADEFVTANEEVFDVLPYITVSIKGEIEGYRYGDPVYYYHGDTLIGKFYFSDVERIGMNQYQVRCISAIGLLENSQHYGNIYTGQTMEEVLAEIIGNVVPYELAPEFKSIKVYGWLPIGTRRSNLHQLLFAQGAAVKKTPEGDILISYISDTTSIEIPDENVFVGGKVDLASPATKVTVNEHTFSVTPADEEKTLFEGSIPGNSILTPKGEAVSGAVVVFDAPVHDLQVSGSTILESNPNYAVLSYSSDCKLTGKLYSHTTRQVSRPSAEAAMARDGGLVSVKDNEVYVENATLVSLVNSENVADRVYAYYGAAQSTTVDIVMGKERPGDNVSFLNPFEQRTSGFIRSMDIQGSTVLKASAEIVEGYIPPMIGNQYSHLEVISSADMSYPSSFTIPDGVTRIRLVLIGGGEGGQSGAAGQPGGNAPWNNSLTGADGGLGGAGGKGGHGGNIYIVSLSVLPGDVVTIISCRGGQGGARSDGEGNFGKPGDDCVVFIDRVDNNGFLVWETEFSSATGSPSAIGYTDPIYGRVYAVPGENGTDGCKGSGKDGPGPAYLYDGSIRCNPGRDGYPSKFTSSEWTAEAMGGYGGGAAFPRGSASGSGIYAGAGGNGQTDYNNGYGFASGGDGGDGMDGRDGIYASGDPTLKPATGELGTGGRGGHGGGGGGGGGGGKHSGSGSYSNGGNGGSGGSGGAGSAGVVGGCLIYY